MEGRLRLNSTGRWEIVDDEGKRLEITSGDVITVWVDGVIGWARTRIESRSKSEPPFEAEYYAVAGYRLYRGQPARTTDEPRYSPG